MRKKKLQQTKNPRKPFREHLTELRKRFFICLSIFLLLATALYPIAPLLLAILLKPLQQTIYYTSPAGGLSVLIQICLLGGFLLSVPVFVYQIYRFLEPIFPKQSPWFLLKILTSALLLLFLGVSFAYVISLPTALLFLQSFSSEHIQPLITTSAYFSFIARYLLGFGILFQLPLILLLINHIQPLSVKKLFFLSQYIIVGSFLIAAIITPTPDPINQALMAIPIILLYYLSVFIIWMRNVLLSRTKSRTLQINA